MLDLTKAPFYLNGEQINWVETTLSSMSLKDKAGQLFNAMAQDYSDEELCELVEEDAIGSVLYRPTYTEEELRRKFRMLDAHAKYPLLKAANLEEGASGAISDGIRFASQMEVSATGKMEDVEHFALACALQSRRAGINWTFSPVSDLSVNPQNPIINVRSFGSDTEQVMQDTRKYVDILQAHGIACAAKHFPGDGIDFRDQHLHPTYNTLPADQWYSTYGRIYENMIQAGILSVMVGHIVEPALERSIHPALTDAQLMPGSLSPELLQGVLRGKLGFQGLIISDATIMNGFCMAMKREDAIPHAIAAGCDMLCFSTDLREDISFVLQGVEEGTITRERLDEAVTRILALKAKVARTKEDNMPRTGKDMQAAGQEISGDDMQLHQWAADCADGAVTLVKDVRATLPITHDHYDRIRLICFGQDKTPDGSLREMVTKELEEAGFPVESYDPYQDELHGTGAIDHRLLTLYISNMEPVSNNTAVRIYWCMKHALDSPRFAPEEDYIFVSFSNPYHLQDVPRIPVYINAYTATKETVHATVQKLLGNGVFRGKSPVDAFCGLIDTKL